MLALDDNNLYWTDDVDRTVMTRATRRRFADDTGSRSRPRLHARRGRPERLLVELRRWRGQARAPSAGGAIATLASGEVNPGPLILLGGNVYWPRAGAGIFVLPLAGGAGHAVPLQGFQPLFGFAIDGDGVYWTTFTGGGVYRAPLAGGATTPLALAAGTGAVPPRRPAVGVLHDRR